MYKTTKLQILSPHFAAKYFWKTNREKGNSRGKLFRKPSQENNWEYLSVTSHIRQHPQHFSISQATPLVFYLSPLSPRFLSLLLPTILEWDPYITKQLPLPTSLPLPLSRSKGCCEGGERGCKKKGKGWWLLLRTERRHWSWSSWFFH